MKSWPPDISEAEINPSEFTEGALEFYENKCAYLEARLSSFEQQRDEIRCWKGECARLEAATDGWQKIALEQQYVADKLREENERLLLMNESDACIIRQLYDEVTKLRRRG